MEQVEDLDSGVAAKSSFRLKEHISAINLAPISRVPASRLQRTALPQIGLIELVSSEAFAEQYDNLYRAMFHGGERERSDLIVERLRQEFAGLREGLSPYRIIGLRNQAGEAIAGAQFSVLMLPGGGDIVPYLQYIYVKPENRRADLSELLHTLVLAVSMADAEHLKRTSSPKVPFTLFETEPPCHGIDEVKRAKAFERASIHTKSGSFAMMLRTKATGKIVSAHVQPGLEIEDPPLTLVWVLRANPAVELRLESQVGPAVIAAYYQSLRDEGFPEKNIALAEGLAKARSQESEYCLMPLAEITKEMYINVD